MEVARHPNRMDTISQTGLYSGAFPPTLRLVSRTDAQPPRKDCCTSTKIMSATHKDTESVSKETDDSSESNIKRYNITMDEEHHDEVVDFVENRGETFSSFVRRAVEARRHRLENDGVAREFQPLLDEIEGVGEGVENLTSQLDQLQSLIKEVAERNGDNVVSDDGDSLSNETTDSVLAHIRDIDGATIPELVEETSFERHTVQRAIARLEADFVITERDENGSVPVWEVR